MPLQQPSTHKPATMQYSPSLAKTFTSTEIGTTIDLRAQVGYPPYAPQRLLLNNTNNAAAGAATLTDSAGNSFVVDVPFSATVVVDCAVLSIVSPGTTDAATFNIVALWWNDGSHPLNTA